MISSGMLLQCFLQMRHLNPVQKALIQCHELPHYDRITLVISIPSYLLAASLVDLGTYVPVQ